MTDKDELDLESYWNRVRRPRSPETSVLNPSWSLNKAIERAVIKTNSKLPERLKDFDIAPALASKIATRVVLWFVENWYEEVRRSEASNLLSVILEAQDLPLDELFHFVRAVPLTLLQRATKVDGPTATGAQALLTIEILRRTGGSDYTLARDLDGVLTVRFQPNDSRTGGQPVVFRLDDKFNL